ncbi:MAG TPA: polysaccharide deacetylase family protein [Steroidobacteraceae bacterium]|nr:polysaccharide deacetylase family protein [Steroidobacteraceae bacterium]
MARWLPTPLMKVSALTHVGAAAALAQPALWPWALGAVVANHAVLATCSLTPRSHWLGSNWTRLPPAAMRARGIAITIDDGPDPEVTPQVLEQLESRHARATFFCVGTQVQRHPELAREIVRRGHAIENHSQHHLHSFSLRGPARIRCEVAEAQDAIARAAGVTPRFFRAPAGLRNPMLQPVLAEFPLQLASWTRRGFDTVNRDADDVLRKLSRDLCAGDILLLHDGHAARTARGVPLILEVLPRLLQQIRDTGLLTMTLAQAQDQQSASGH